jgi:DNA mismatch repair protein MutS2
LRLALYYGGEATAQRYATLDIEFRKKEKERQRQFEKELAQTIEDFERQSKTFVQSIEDKVLRAKLDKERSARKAELNRAVLNKFSNAERGTRNAESKPNAQSFEIDNRPIAVGSKVRTSFGNVGTVEKIDRDTAEVLVGAMRLREKLTNLQAVAGGDDRKNNHPGNMPKHSQASNLRLDAEDMNAELNLIGRTTADAEYEIDRFLDEAYLAALPRVRIIHGFGTGALKNFVHHFLKGHPHILKFGFAPSDQGGNGATIAELKQ